MKMEKTSSTTATSLESFKCKLTYNLHTIFSFLNVTGGKSVLSDVTLLEGRQRNFLKNEQSDADHSSFDELDTELIG
jgi:hypothetical protein